jgi:hypothetical protein
VSASLNSLRVGNVEGCLVGYGFLWWRRTIIWRANRADTVIDRRRAPGVAPGKK